MSFAGECSIVFNGVSRLFLQIYSPLPTRGSTYFRPPTYDDSTESTPVGDSDSTESQLRGEFVYQSTGPELTAWNAQIRRKMISQYKGLLLKIFKLLIGKAWECQFQTN